MNIELRNQLVARIKTLSTSDSVFKDLTLDPTTGEGSITYNTDSIKVDASAPGFNKGKTKITDEELVRAFLLCRLVFELKYPADKIEIEKVYKSVGRPGKGGRIDIIVRNKATTRTFLFIECKEPEKYYADLKFIDGQLFRLSKQEDEVPNHFVYYTAEYNGSAIADKIQLINPKTYPTYEAWDKAGQPYIDTIPANYGVPAKRLYANVTTETKTQRPLNYSKTSYDFSRLRNEVHDVIWGGGGTNNNEVFVYIVKLILCKIYDELETQPGNSYTFQRLGDSESAEEAVKLVDRMNKLYAKAEKEYLALQANSQGPAFDPVKISAQKVAYVVTRLEDVSVTKNTHNGDLLGEFFEQIVSSDFTQTKGQFFTPPKVVRFILELTACAANAEEVFLHHKDHLGRPRLPYVIDPSCGSGTFLIEYMKAVTARMTNGSLSLTRKLKETHDLYFGGEKRNAWARDYLFGIENNYDLGLAAKVNMVLHGDGSMNTWITSGLRPFTEYWIAGRHNVLGVASKSPKTTGYEAQVNEQFDLILSNPPFSLTLAPDEKSEVSEAFDGTLKVSEDLFIERWYQLLRAEGTFCAVLPESIIDTPNNAKTREFLIKHFSIKAIVSLPYDAFKPFTSTKTSIILAQKRKVEDIAKFTAVHKELFSDEEFKGNLLLGTLKKLGWHTESIFMAEPEEVGYKRRKNLPDLPLKNDLYQEDANGFLKQIDKTTPKTVLDYYHSTNAAPNSELGFRVTLESVCERDGCRLDPKYVWLWTKQKGVVDNAAQKNPLGQLMKVSGLEKIKKGDLATERVLIDLDAIEARMAEFVGTLPTVDEIGSDRILFGDIDLAFSKLEPYLGKLILEPNPEAIGSTEWVGFCLKDKVPPLYAAYLLLRPEMCAAYRRLQSGKRHARLNPDEMLELIVRKHTPAEQQAIEAKLTDLRKKIAEMKAEVQKIRTKIDQAFS